MTTDLERSQMIAKVFNPHPTGPSPVRLYRVVRPSPCGGYCEWHEEYGWQYCVEGEWLTTDYREACEMAAAHQGDVEDVTAPYSGSGYEHWGIGPITTPEIYKAIQEELANIRAGCADRNVTAYAWRV